MHLPLAVTDDLVVRELADETMVYDKKRQKSHCLNRTSAWVWRHCDGKTSVEELARRMHEELGLPNCEELVHLALDQLARRHLVQQVPERPADARRSRRDVLKALAVAAATLPVIMTLATRTARAKSGFISFVSLDGCKRFTTQTPGGVNINEGKACKNLVTGVTGVCRNGNCVAQTAAAGPNCAGPCMAAGDCASGCRCVGATRTTPGTCTA